MSFIQPSAVESVRGFQPFDFFRAAGASQYGISVREATKTFNDVMVVSHALVPILVLWSGIQLNRQALIFDQPRRS